MLRLAMAPLRHPARTRSRRGRCAPPRQTDSATARAQWREGRAQAQQVWSRSSHAPVWRRAHRDGGLVVHAAVSSVTFQSRLLRTDRESSRASFSGPVNVNGSRRRQGVRRAGLWVCEGCVVTTQMCCVSVCLCACVAVAAVGPSTSLCVYVRRCVRGLVAVSADAVPPSPLFHVHIKLLLTRKGRLTTDSDTHTYTHRAEGEKEGSPSLERRSSAVAE